MTLKDKKIQVSVRDEGIGIAPEYQERIFQRFYRVFDEKDKTYPGLGMGLFISKTIVEQHGGSIWLTSEPQKGSTFFVSLPIRARKEKS
jgi:signal transduction histidine kinase